MKAVILAAGLGKRLHVLTQHRPKCLMDIGGRPLLYRYLDALRHLGVTPVSLVVGYKQEHIREAVAAYPSPPPDITFLVNHDFERGSIGSLWAARPALDTTPNPAMNPAPAPAPAPALPPALAPALPPALAPALADDNNDAIIMDADVLFHPAILDRLVASSHPNALLMDETVTQQTEECMVAVRDGRVVALSKRVPDTCDLIGEGVGFLRVSHAAVPRLLQSVETRITQGLLDIEYEDALEDFFRDVPVGVEPIGGLPWIEIDFPEDLERARNEILPQLEPHDAGRGGGPAIS